MLAKSVERHFLKFPYDANGALRGLEIFCWFIISVNSGIISVVKWQRRSFLYTKFSIVMCCYVYFQIYTILSFRIGNDFADNSRFSTGRMKAESKRTNVAMRTQRMESPKSATTGSESDGELPVLQRNFLHPDIPIWRLTSWAPVRAVADGSADVVTSSHPSPCNTSSIWMFSRTDNEDDLTVSLASADWPQQLPQLCWIVQTARKVERSLLREEIYRVLDFLGNASWR